MPGRRRPLILRKVPVPTPDARPADARRPRRPAPTRSSRCATATPTPSAAPPAAPLGQPDRDASPAPPSRAATSVSVTVSRLSVSGRVKGAVSGYVHVTVQRKRGKRWVTVRRAKDRHLQERPLRGRDRPPLARHLPRRRPLRGHRHRPALPLRVPHPPPVKGSDPSTLFLALHRRL